MKKMKKSELELAYGEEIYYNQRLRETIEELRAENKELNKEIENLKIEDEFNKKHIKGLENIIYLLKN